MNELEINEEEIREFIKKAYGIDDSEIDMLLSARGCSLSDLKDYMQEMDNRAIVEQEELNQYSKVMELLDIEEKKINGEWQKVVRNTIDNYCIILSNDDKFSNVFHDVMKDAPVKQINGKFVQWLDADDAEARRYIEKQYGIKDIKSYNDAFSILMRDRPMDPVQLMISGIKWDGKPRISGILQKWLKAPDNEYTKECARLIFAGGINRAYHPGCKFDDVVVFLGKTGCGKSTFCHYLALNEEFFNDTRVIKGQKGLEAIAGKWIVEISELLATSSNGNNETQTEDFVKAFISGQSDVYRLPYAIHPADHPRHNIFIGTSNRDAFLTDVTGNRRWYPLKLGATQADARYMVQHEKECHEDIRQCWAEMKAAFDAHDQMAAPVVKADLLDVVQAVQAEAMQEDWRIGAIEEYLQTNQKERVCLKELWECALYPSDGDRREFKRKDQNELAEILCNQLHWKRGNTATFQGYGRQKAYLPDTLVAADTDTELLL